MSPTSIGGSSALQQQLQAMFAKADLNADGQLSSDEFQAIGQSLPQPGSSGQARPLRGDGGGGQNFAAATMGSLLSMQESRAEKIFSDGDSNGDGALSLDEFKAARPPQGPQGGGDIDAAAKKKDPLDTNGDGKVSMAELLASLQTATSTQTGFSNDAAGMLARLISQLTADTTSGSATSTTAVAA